MKNGPMDHPDDEVLADRLKRLNEPPATPRDRMWDRIDAARRDRRGRTAPLLFRHPRRHSALWRTAAAAAAVLVLGFGIGRLTGPGPVPFPAAVTDPTEAVSGAPVRVRDDIYRLAAIDLFSRADVLLTDVKARPCSTSDLGEVPAWAGGMLLQTRLLMDTPVAGDPEVRSLLEDLELVLAQIAGLSRNDCSRDMAWIKDGLQERSTLNRLRVLTDSGAPGRAL
ncbi:MAG: hypothetical protein AB7V45_03550 [Candidatus Krumholzibacteriia bacterium]